MIEAYFRPFFQKLFVDPVACFFCHKQNISPIYITFSAGLLGILAAFSIAFGLKWSALVLLLVSGYLDLLDGTLARFFEKSTPRGAVLDILMDRIVEGSLIIGLYYVDPVLRAVFCLWMLFSMFLCVTSFLVVGVFSQNNSSKSFYYSPGIIERCEAFIFFSLMIVFPNYFKLFSLVFTVLVLLTTLVRIIEFFRKENA